MKSDNARIKELEAKIKLLEKEKEFFKLKAVAWETLVDVAEETGAVLTDAYFHQKKVRTQTVEKLTCRYPLLGMSLLCSLFGFSRQAWYAAIKQKEEVSFEFDAVLAEILAIRKRIPGIGTAKLYELLKPFLSSHFIKMGRDKIHYLLKKEGLLVKKKGRRVGTTNSDHCLKKYPNLVKDIIPTETEVLWVSEMTGTPSLISRVVVALLIYH